MPVRSTSMAALTVGAEQWELAARRLVAHVGLVVRGGDGRRGDGGAGVAGRRVGRQVRVGGTDPEEHRRGRRRGEDLVRGELEHVVRRPRPVEVLEEVGRAVRVPDVPTRRHVGGRPPELGRRGRPREVVQVLARQDRLVPLRVDAGGDGVRVVHQVRVGVPDDARAGGVPAREQRGARRPAHRHLDGRVDAVDPAGVQAGEEAPVVEAHVVGDDHDDRARRVRVRGGRGQGRGRGGSAGRQHGGGPRHRTSPLQELPSGEGHLGEALLCERRAGRRRPEGSGPRLRTARRYGGPTPMVRRGVTPDRRMRGRATITLGGRPRSGVARPRCGVGPSSAGRRRRLPVRPRRRWYRSARYGVRLRAQLPSPPRAAHQGVREGRRAVRPRRRRARRGRAAPGGLPDQRDRPLPRGAGALAAHARRAGRSMRSSWRRRPRPSVRWSSPTTRPSSSSTRPSRSCAATGSCATGPPTTTRTPRTTRRSSAASSRSTARPSRS